MVRLVCACLVALVFQATSWAYSPFPFYTGGMENPYVGMNAAGAADFYYPRVIVVDPWGGYYQRSYQHPRYDRYYRDYRGW